MSLEEWHDFMNQQARKEQGMSQSTGNVSSLFKAAQAEGNLSAQSLQALNVVDPGAQIQAGLGVDVGDVEASEVVLVMMIIDDSSSIRFVTGNTEAVRDGHNTCLAALKDSKQAGAIITGTRYLNKGVLFPFCQLKDSIEMTAGNYDPSGGTPLYDQVIIALGQVIAKAQEFSDNGVSVRTVTAIITDGHDESSHATASQVRSVVSDMLKQENHVVMAMGITDGGTTDFEQIFQSMGIPKEWILTPKNTPKEIRRAFQTVSQSAVRLSQSATFSKTALGGFGG